MKSNWILPKPPDQEEIELLSEALNIPKTITSLLLVRGYNDPKKAARFLHPEIGDMYDPFLMKDMNKAVSRIIKAIRNKEKILIYGDYDVDGTTATALLYRILKEIGNTPLYYIPHRLKEGYGITDKGIRFAKQSYVNLIITVDCGVCEVPKVSALNELGIDVIITDHHEPKETLPEAVAILDPKIDDYPCKDLSGCGVALKLAQALYKELGLNPLKLMRYFDLVALSTVADVVPLTDENRIITKFGIQRLERTSNIGLKSLLEITGLINAKLSTYHIGFILGPRVNAQGRLGEARDVVLLLTTEDREEAYGIAKKLDDENRKRMKIQEEIVEDAYKKVKELDLEETKGVVLAAEEWHPGVIGVAASKIVEKFYRPVILIALDGDMGKGSARSIPEFHLYNALKECNHIFESFGGHKLAAGLIIERKNIDELKTTFNKIAINKLKGVKLVNKVFIDQELPLTKIDEALLNGLNAFNPLGLGNPKPLFLAKNVQVVGYPKILNNTHLKFKVRANDKIVSAIAWHSEGLFNSITTGIKVDLVYGLRESEYLGRSEIELNVVDVDILT